MDYSPWGHEELDTTKPLTLPEGTISGVYLNAWYTFIEWMQAALVY